MISLSLHTSWPRTWSIRRHGLLGQAPPDETRWKKMHCLPFLDSESSRLPWRAFYVSKTAVEASELDERIRVYYWIWLGYPWQKGSTSPWWTMSIDWFNSSSLCINASLTARFAGSQTFSDMCNTEKLPGLRSLFLKHALGIFWTWQCKNCANVLAVFAWLKGSLRHLQRSQPVWQLLHLQASWRPGKKGLRWLRSDRSGGSPMIPISFASRNVRHFEEAMCKCCDLFWLKFTTYRSEDIEKCWKVREVAASVCLLCLIGQNNRWNVMKQVRHRWHTETAIAVTATIARWRLSCLLWGGKGCDF